MYFDRNTWISKVKQSLQSTWTNVLYFYIYSKYLPCEINSIKLINENTPEIPTIDTTLQWDPLYPVMDTVLYNSLGLSWAPHSLPFYLASFYFRNEELERLLHIAVSHLYPDINILVDESSPNFFNDIIVFIQADKVKNSFFIILNKVIFILYFKKVSFPIL